jgi:ribonuclease HI
MPQTTTPRGKTEPVTTLTTSEVASMRVALAALKYLHEREKCEDSAKAGAAITAVIGKWEKKPKAKA